MSITEAMESAIGGVVGQDGIGVSKTGDYEVIAFWEDDEMVVEFESDWCGKTTRISKDAVGIITAGK